MLFNIYFIDIYLYGYLPRFPIFRQGMKQSLSGEIDQIGFLLRIDTNLDCILKYFCNMIRGGTMRKKWKDKNQDSAS